MIVSVLTVYYAFYDRFIGGVASPDFEVSAGFETLSIHYLSGSTNSTIVRIKSIHGFEGVISLELKKSFGIAPGLDLLLEPEEVNLTLNQTVQTALTIIARYTVPKGQYHVDIVCKGNGIQHTVRVNINVES